MDTRNNEEVACILMSTRFSSAKLFPRKRCTPDGTPKVIRATKTEDRENTVEYMPMISAEANLEITSQKIELENIKVIASANRYAAPLPTSNLLKLCH
jgi:hypothetical protein